MFRNTAALFCLVIGFFTGVGCYFTGAQIVVGMQSKKIAGITDAYYEQKRLCVEEKADILERFNKVPPRQKKRSLGKADVSPGADG